MYAPIDIHKQIVYINRYDEVEKDVEMVKISLW